MKKTIVLLTLALLFPLLIHAHPGSGIVVDRNGNVYFLDTGAGVWKIDRNGKVSRYPGIAYHWMAIDQDGALKNVSLPNFSRGGAVVERGGSDPTMILSSDFPVTIGRDGSLYYPWLSGSQVSVYRLSPSGKTSTLAILPESTESGPLQWLNGIAAGPDGSIYFAEDRAVRKISPQGKLSTIADSISPRGCASIPGIEGEDGPYLRGLAVDEKGTVYVAASGCGSVLKITPDGRISTILTATSPWSPTAVVLSGKDLYVLEYLHKEGDNRREWMPRVRKVSADGGVSTIAEIKER